MRNEERQRKGFLIRVLTAAALAFALPSTVSAVIINVAPGEVAIASNGRCSLREAIDNANADAQVGGNPDCPAGSGADIIVLAAGSTYTIRDEFASGSGDGLPIITSTVTIQGNGATIERDATLNCYYLDPLHTKHEASEFRIFEVAPSGNLTISQVTIQNGCAHGPYPKDDGGAIEVDDGGTLELSQVTVRANAAQDKSGGVDDNPGSSIVIVDSTIAQNTALGGGGGLGNGYGGTMTILRSTITENSASGVGAGGVGNFGVMDIINSTISGNTANSTVGGGGGIGNTGTLRIASSTIFDNAAPAGLGGGGIGNAGSVQIRNSIIAGSTSGGDCVNLASFTALGANLDSDGSCPGFTQTTLAALALGPLAANGGPTETHALERGSVAVDAAPNCVSVDGSTPITQDQRSVRRPQNAICDIGAFELQVSASPAPALGALGRLLVIMALIGVAARRLGSSPPPARSPGP